MQLCSYHLQLPYLYFFVIVSLLCFLHSINLHSLLFYISAGYVIQQNPGMLSVTLKEILTYKQICAQLRVSVEEDLKGILQCFAFFLLTWVIYFCVLSISVCLSLSWAWSALGTWSLEQTFTSWHRFSVSFLHYEETVVCLELESVY